MKTAYFDTCIVSGLAKEDLSPPDLGALMDILRARKAGAISIYTSELAKREIDQIPEAYRRKHQFIYELLDGIPLVPGFYRPRGWGALHPIGPHVRAKPALAKLSHLLPGNMDAAHIFQAAENDIEYFVTVDTKTILAHRVEIERITSMKVRSPLEFVVEIPIL